MRLQAVSRSHTRAGSAMQPKALKQDKDVSILHALPMAILGMIACIQVPTTNSGRHRKKSHFHRTSAQLMTETETLLILQIIFWSWKKPTVCVTDSFLASPQQWNNIHQHQDGKTLALALTDESLTLTKIPRLSQTAKDLFPNLLLPHTLHLQPVMVGDTGNAMIH